MKRFLMIMMSLGLMLLSALTVDAKKAILVGHYGSSDANTREKTIGRITADIKAALTGYEVREAYISPVVRNNMEKNGLTADSPKRALVKLATEGYDTIYVQSTTLLDGAEMAEVRKDCNEVSGLFSLLKIGKALCYSPSDCETVVEILTKEIPGAGEAVIYVGHGNLLPSTATYAQLDYMLEDKGHHNIHVSTIEGYPTAETTISELRKSDKKIKKVRLVPLLLVCGNHTKNDIAGEYARELNEAGYSTEVVMRGLGENPEVRSLYVDRVKKLVE